MSKRHGKCFAVIGVLALALALSGCGNSKKGNGYGLAPSAHSVALARATIHTR